MFKNKNRIKLKRDRSGAILAFVLIVLLVVAVLTASIVHLNMANTAQVSSQRDYLQAYYLAYSGIEIGYAALMMDNENPPVDGYLNLLEDIIDNSPHTVADMNIEYGENGDNISVEIEYVPDDKTITIVSIGTHKNSNKSTKLTMSYPVDFPSLRTWK
jgi:hypothetical protein